MKVVPIAGMMAIFRTVSSWEYFNEEDLLFRVFLDVEIIIFWHSWILLYSIIDKLI